MAGKALRINTPQVVTDGIDDEVMVINLDTGTYYELAAVGADVWRSFAAGLTLDQCVDVVASRYEADRDTIADALGGFVGALEAEGLVCPAAAGGAGDAPATPPPPVEPRMAFRAPLLEPFVDLQMLIQLDPILEQDEQGWPAVNEKR